MEQKFEMGPLQKAWVKSLREHPERQTSKYLGYGTPENYKACCLGELLVCANNMGLYPGKSVFDGISISDNSEGLGDTFFLTDTMTKVVGLIDRRGRILGRGFGPGGLNTLARVNDAGISWSAIADFIEANPERVFTHPV